MAYQTIVDSDYLKDNLFTRMGRFFDFLKHDCIIMSVFMAGSLDAEKEGKAIDAIHMAAQKNKQ